MFCISTRTTGRTSPNTRRPSRGSNNSLDCHCMKKERSDENVSHRIFAGIDWKHHSRCHSRWVVAPLSRSEAHGGCGNQKGKFRRAGFDGQLDGFSSCINRSAAGSGADLSATVAEHRCKDRPVFTPMLCNRCGEICTGTSGASVDAGGETIELAIESCAAEFAFLVSASAMGFAVR